MDIYTPSDSFVYYWQNSQNNKIYLGFHKGSPSDGYTHSSGNKKFIKEFKEHPKRFVRTIVAYGALKDMCELEANILHFVDARNNALYYNRNNGGAKFTPNNSIACTWEGNQYSSMKDIAKAVGVTHTTIYRWIRKGYTSMADAKRGFIKEYERVGPKPCIWEGNEYPSIKAAAKAIGVARATFGGWIQKGYTCMADVERGNAEGYAKRKEKKDLLLV